MFCVRTERSVWVQCLRCGHVGVLTVETLSRLAIAPSTPIAAFVKRLRCRRCGSQSVRATRQACPTAKGFLMCGRFTAALVAIASELRVRATLVVIAGEMRPVPEPSAASVRCISWNSI